MKTLLVVILTLIFSKAVSAKTEVEFKSSVEIGSALSLQLEDLVNLKNQSISTIRSIIDMDLPFKEATVSKEDVLTWLKSAIIERPDLREISFKVPQQIEITRSVGLAKSQIRQRIQTRLSLKCTDCQFQVQISNVPEIKTKTVVLDWKDIPLSGAFMLPVTSTEGQNLSWISGQIKAQRQVVKAARVFRAGDTIAEADLIMDQADVTFIKDFYLKKSELIGKKANRFVSMGTLLTSNDIQREYDVRQGQTVKTVTGNETFEITLQTVAQESGVSGDTIRVRNTSNQKIMSARIMDKGTVRIE
jgi:flagella basal body P-ring formation protein FlgA